jgi:hypothetical protein
MAPPIFLMNGATDCLELKFRQVIRSYAKARDEANTDGRVRSIPVASDLRGVFFVQDWVEDWLAGQPRRKGTKIGLFYEL